MRPFPLSWMYKYLNLLHFINARLRIDLRGAQLHMAQHCLNEPDICPILQHQSRHGVTEPVATARLADLGLINVITHQCRQRMGAEGVARPAQEQSPFIRTTGQLGPGFIKVFIHPQ